MVVRQSVRTPQPAIVAEMSRPPAGPVSSVEPAPPPVVTPPAEQRRYDAVPASRGRLAKPTTVLERDTRTASVVKQKEEVAAVEKEKVADGAYGGAAPAPKTVPGGSAGGVVGGVVGGVSGAPAVAPVTPLAGFREGVPGGVLRPPAMAPPPVTVAQQQAGQTPSAQQSVQVQSSTQSVSTLDDLKKLDSNAPTNALANQNARALFYGRALEDQLLAAQTEYKVETAAPPAAKKVAQSEDADKQNRQNEAKAVNRLAVMGRAAQVPLPHPGVRYSLLRKSGSGSFEPVDPDALKTGDTVELRFEPNDTGSLAVLGRDKDGRWQDVFSKRVERLKAYTTSPLKSGVRELRVTFSRLPATLTRAALRDAKDVGRASVAQQTTSEPATYVVGDPASQVVTFDITLTFK